ncbi:MAG: type I restriction enzyme S subunit [Desulforhopalus sp.]|jgi:type I restriction enzyme S subunit
MVKRYPAYSEYKSTHLGWLNRIPDHWQIKRLKYLGDAIIGLTYSPNDVVEESKGVLVLRSSNIQNKKLTYEDNVYVDKRVSPKLVTQKGDILICARNGSRALIGKNAQIDDRSTGLTFGAFMSIFRGPLNDYLSQVFNSTLFEYQSGSFLTSTINQLTTGNLNNFEIPLPPEDERAQIANFLDHETAKIDTLIEKQQQLIALLKEKRQAVISHAVTKGLNPDAPMKDSGVEWLGEVPEHWDTCKLKHACTDIFLGLTSRVDYVEDGGVPLVRALNISGGILDLEFAREISIEQHKQLTKYRRAVRDDILLSKSGTIGTAAIVDIDEEFSIYESIFALRAYRKNLIPEYLLCYIQSSIAKGQYAKGAVGMGVHHLNMPDIQDVIIPLPPLTEQVKIYEFLNRQRAKLNLLEERANQQINLLKERRTALISAAVTGKIDVRNWQQPTTPQNTLDTP